MAARTTGRRLYVERNALAIYRFGSSWPATSRTRVFSRDGPCAMPTPGSFAPGHRGPICTLAWCATYDGDFERGAQLIAVFDHLVEGLPDLLDLGPKEQAVRDANIARLVDGLGPAEYEHHREIGLQLSFGHVLISPWAGPSESPHPIIRGSPKET